MNERLVTQPTAKTKLLRQFILENFCRVPNRKENLALIQTIFGENSQTISTINRLLHTPYQGSLYGVAPITPTLLRLDPLWDPLRGDPAFQKLCEEKQP